MTQIRHLASELLQRSFWFLAVSSNARRTKDHLPDGWHRGVGHTGEHEPAE